MDGTIDSWPDNYVESVVVWKSDSMSYDRVKEIFEEKSVAA